MIRRNNLNKSVMQGLLRLLALLSFLPHVVDASSPLKKSRGGLKRGLLRPARAALLATALSSAPSAGATAPPPPAVAVDSEPSVAVSGAQLVFIGLNALAKGVRLYGAIEAAREWLERFIGKSKRRQEIWDEYIAKRDVILESCKDAASSTVRVEDLRREFQRKYPAWKSLWEAS